MPARRTAGRRPTVRVYQLELTLAEVEPRIWRRLRVTDDVILHSLHLTFQHAMGWTNSHLYEFGVGGRRFSEPDPDDDLSEEPAEDACRTRLRELGLREGSEFTYVYDFGDWWEHRIVIEAVSPLHAGEVVPRCMGGAMAGPLEDSGGPHGYEELLVALRDPRHPEHRSASEWTPTGFDPESFDAEATTELLQHFHRKPRSRARRATSRRA